MSQLSLMTAVPTTVSTPHKRHTLAALTLAAIGVVYGDIGTSPLYTFKEIFSPATGVALNEHNLIGASSVILWALMLVVTLKYVILVLRADNKGEGGVLALTALATQVVSKQGILRVILLLLGVFGATLFYGDSVITPAISVLGAMEGLEVVTPHLKPYVVPLSVMILIGLFLLQRFGTARVGKLFGPVIVIWFITLAVTGVMQIAQAPSILAALNPAHAYAFLSERGWHVFVAVGAIVLALTGAEALYADMGHFGRRPVQIAWTSLVLPSLALNYMGQGALLINTPAALENPFYRMFPETLLWPALILSTLAAIIASQAVISGAYSMTKQAIQLGFLPRMSIRYTSVSEAGQIYMPAVNWILLLGVAVAVVAFGSSSALAGAYGIAVTMTMLITTFLTYFVVRRSWHLPAPVAISATAFFLILDSLLVISCSLKFLDGGWFPLALGLLLFLMMSTWSRGRARQALSMQSEGLSLQDTLDNLSHSELHHVPRTAVYCVSNPEVTPHALLHNLKHNQVLHVRNVIATVKFSDMPTVSTKDRVEVASLGHGFWRVTLNFGFMDTPDVPAALALVSCAGLAIHAAETSYFLSRETLVPTHGTGLGHWRDRIFAVMSRHSSGVAEFFRLPDNAVVELGTRLQL